jgi:hypothetical protein
MPESILDRYVSISYDPGTNTYRYAKSWVIAEPAARPSRKQNWIDKLTYSDADPVFQDLMRAGYALANVPIHPGSEGAIDYFLATGDVWMGGSLPAVGSETILPIAKEISERLYKGHERNMAILGSLGFRQISPLLRETIGSLSGIRSMENGSLERISANR